MPKKILFGIVGIVLLVIALFAGFRGGWSDDDCFEAFDQLWWLYAHEASGENWFTVPDYWSGTHGNPTFRGRSVDADYLLDGLENRCGHLYSVVYTGSATVVKSLDDDNSSWITTQPAPAFAWASSIPMILAGIVVVFVLLFIVTRGRMRLAS